MSTRGTLGGGTDYWLMDPDGSNKKQMTQFSQPGCAEYSSDPLVASDNPRAPDGRSFAAFVQTDLFSQEGKLVLIQLGGDE